MYGLSQLLHDTYELLQLLHATHGLPLTMFYVHLANAESWNKFYFF